MPSRPCDRSQVSSFPCMLSLLYTSEGLSAIQWFWRADNWCRSPSVLPVLWEKCPRNDTLTNTQLLFILLALCHTHSSLFTLVTSIFSKTHTHTHTCFRCFGSLTQSCWGWKGRTCSQQVPSSREKEREKCWHAIADAIHTSHSICLGQNHTKN